MSASQIKEKIYIPIHTTNNQLVLSGLGKSTKRGIKKCNNCSTYNGTRSAVCKNKNCGVILKDSEEKSRVDIDAVKLLTGKEKQVFSVRVRDMGPDYRGFVQLPILQSQEDKNILSEVALCFVDSCQNSFDNSILKCHEEDQNSTNQVCDHIKSALKSQSSATPMKFKNDVLGSLQVTDDVKETLYILANEKQGCLVQQVSKSIMAVKCQATPKHPLGYLHFGFIKGKGRYCYEKYFCSCSEFIESRSIPGKEIRKCIHYYACIWSLASNTRYFDEFSYFLQFELPLSEPIFGHLNDKPSPLSETSKYIQQAAAMKVTANKCLDERYRKSKVIKVGCPSTKLMNIC
ncbi:unnamed protein product [Acanthoscelides obtectus]|uniref:Putative treble-clef zinc-finger domain-containing protein n=1 Tax=Acanthoscelides obtectus TaxID=200917 RepID=A0A9P0LRE7_ACAOB|nr:unnamed protein product [Acanthoscelides obtectus]CAK1620389.1 hypothetical protein AOBTE_LOCUS351 [Acanthoscelides obtectus]